MSDPYSVVREFEAALCAYTGAQYAVTTSSCTMALLLAVLAGQRQSLDSVSLSVRAHRVLTADGVTTLTALTSKTANELMKIPGMGARTLSEIQRELADRGMSLGSDRRLIEIPRLTYVGVPMSIMHAGCGVRFRDEDWQGSYQLRPLLVYDCARRFTRGMFGASATVLDHPWQEIFQCVSFHHGKILGLAAHGGAILHNSYHADKWLRRARFDGRTEGVAPKYDTFDLLGYHCYMTPATAAEGLMRLSVLPRDNADLPRSDYADLSKVELFK